MTRSPYRRRPGPLVIGDLPPGMHCRGPGQFVRGGVDGQPVAIAGPRSVGLEARLDEHQLLRSQLNQNSSNRAAGKSAFGGKGWMTRPARAGVIGNIGERQEN